MTDLIPLVVTVVAGAGIGWLTDRVRLPAMLRSVVAGLLGWGIGTLVRVGFWITRASTDVGSATVSLSASGVLFMVVVVVVMALAVHRSLGRPGGAPRRLLAAGRATIAGAIGGLLGGLPFLPGATLIG
jgi:hypothetical protein